MISVLDTVRFTRCVCHLTDAAVEVRPLHQRGVIDHAVEDAEDDGRQ